MHTAESDCLGLWARSVFHWSMKAETVLQAHPKYLTNVRSRSGTSSLLQSSRCCKGCIISLLLTDWAARRGMALYSSRLIRLLHHFRVDQVSFDISIPTPSNNAHIVPDSRGRCLRARPDSHSTRWYPPRRDMFFLERLVLLLRSVCPATHGQLAV